MPFFIVQRASRSFCRNRSWFSSQPSGSLPALISLFSSRVLRCFGTGTRVASMICPPRAWRPWERRYDSNISKRSSITPALRSRTLKKATVVASGILFITPSPTNSSKERLSLTWNSSSSSLRLKKLLEYKHFEKDQRIDPLAPCIALALMRIALIKKWTE